MWTSTFRRHRLRNRNNLSPLGHDGRPILVHCAQRSPPLLDTWNSLLCALGRRFNVGKILGATDWGELPSGKTSREPSGRVRWTVLADHDDSCPHFAGGLDDEYPTTRMAHETDNPILN